MSTHLSRFIRQRRIDLGLRPGQVARKMGGRRCKTANLISLFEERGEIDPRLFPKLQAALDITDAEVEEHMEQDRREHFEAWMQWVNEPVQPHLVVRAMAGFLLEHQLPCGLESLEDMEQYAAAYAKAYRKLVWLCPGTRRFTVRFDEQGEKIEVVEATPDTMAIPWMRLAKDRRQFLFGSQGGGVLSMKTLSQPERPGPRGEP